MSVGEQKKEENLFLNISLHWQKGLYLGHSRSKVLLPFSAQNQNIWLSFMPSRNRYELRDCSVRWDTPLMTRTSFTLTARALLLYHRILSIMQGPNTLIFNIISSGIV